MIQMYNILIVDDEKLSADGIYEFLKNECTLDINLYKSYNAFEALSLLDRVKVDIILLDINMPGMSGLDLQTELIRKWPRCKVIFLTGYNDFEYAQTALRSHCVDYILKTEGDEVVLAAIEKAVQQIEQEFDAEKLLEQASEILKSTLPSLRQQYLIELIHGTGKTDHRIDKDFSELGLCLSPSEKVFLILGIVDCWSSTDTFMIRNDKLIRIRSIVEEYLKDSLQMEYILLGHQQFALLLQPKISWNSSSIETGWVYTNALINGAIDTIQQKCQKLLGISLTFTTSEAAFTWNDLHLCYERQDRLMELNAGITTEMIISSDNILHEVEIDEQDLSEVRSMLKRLSMYDTLLSGKHEIPIKALLDEVSALIRSKGALPKSLRMELYLSIARLFLSYMNRRGIYHKMESRFNLETLTQIDLTQPDERLLAHFSELSELMTGQQAEEQIYYVNLVIKNLQEYIHGNLGGDLSINRLGEVSHFNPSYLSRLFKNFTGKSISEYIWECKLEKACELLIKEQTKINEIAVSLGFESPAYFTRFFKKNTGMTPQEFRTGK